MTVWQLYGFQADETLAVDQKLRQLTGARAGELLGLGFDALYGGDHEIQGDDLTRLATVAGFEPVPGVTYYLGYRVTYLPIWEKGTEPGYFWRDGKDVVL